MKASTKNVSFIVRTRKYSINVLRVYTKFVQVKVKNEQKTENIRENLIWVDISNKTSWVWNYFKLATDGKTY
ncbi:unnamed protein product [Rhizophagus irregularis]|uniref:Uncharacterized protein n=1 Tax=Rhizophagus irregularis TaxID=588596 RepID=A0A916DYB9_9GLOM|nr:unnamed protein product [Rhizophagus irregularis]CAB5174017.1 unnamed protein product [Rhizophagus irregularis]CAB5312007.1 unnamed protein product [Rhizophagus irregularis]